MSVEIQAFAHIFVSTMKATCNDATMQIVLQGPVRRTEMGLRTRPDCNRFKRTNGPGHPNFFEKDQKRLQS